MDAITIVSLLVLAGIAGFIAVTGLRRKLRLTETKRGWGIGPIIKGKSASIGMPLTFDRSFNFPQPTAAAGHVHYLTKPAGSLAGKRAIRLRYRIDGDVQLLGKSDHKPGTISLYFQREGDDWGAQGSMEAYRWWSQTRPLETGEHEIIAPLDSGWRAVMRSTSENNPRGFESAKLHAGRVGFTLGDSTGLGHGVYATSSAKFTVLEFSII